VSADWNISRVQGLGRMLATMPPGVAKDALASECCRLLAEAISPPAPPRYPAAETGDRLVEVDSRELATWAQSPARLKLLAEARRQYLRDLQAWHTEELNLAAAEERKVKP
jgi:hypothetical protein